MSLRLITKAGTDVQPTVPITKQVDFTMQATLRLGDNFSQTVDQPNFASGVSVDFAQRQENSKLGHDSLIGATRIAF